MRGYERGWTVHTAARRGANLGGVAYCWRDRYEATATWFGLTDSVGRMKPAGLAMQRLWTGRSSPAAPRILDLEVPGSPLLPGSTIQVRAEVEVPRGMQVSYHWRVGSENFDFKGAKIRAEKDAPRATITLPRTPGIYRVYFAVADAHTADEANLPIEVNRDISAGRIMPTEVTSFPLHRVIAGP